MNLYIDCEWNDFRGELISMALIDEAEHAFYAVLGCEHPTPWVAAHVMPVLDQRPIPWAEFQWALQTFLGAYDAVHVVADWPEDLERFCHALILGPGQRLTTPPLTMEVLHVEALSAQPHNALADALALKRLLCAEG